MEAEISLRCAMQIYDGPRQGNALVAESHSLYRRGLVNLLVEQCGFKTVFEATSLDEALRRLADDPKISFATFDLDMPGMSVGSSLTSVRRVVPEMLLVVVSASETRQNIIASLIAGAHGYAPKSLDTVDLANALTQVLSGRIFVPWSVSALAESPETRPESPPNGSQDPAICLTKRQQEVFRLVRLKRSNKEIARELGLTENTVKVHTVALYKALQIKGRSEADSVIVEAVGHTIVPRRSNDRVAGDRRVAAMTNALSPIAPSAPESSADVTSRG